ncbi:hypothetical protein, partial [Bosea sp. CRIB-10]|uniref:hypothetical protein n=1 Tax=Bosea sp. CRIB-10 TaxID=378404 RepID=UPI001AECA43E
MDRIHKFHAALLAAVERFLTQAPGFSAAMAARSFWTAPGPLDIADLSFEHRRLVMSSQRFAPEFK